MVKIELKYRIFSGLSKQRVLLKFELQNRTEGKKREKVESIGLGALFTFELNQLRESESSNNLPP